MPSAYGSKTGAAKRAKPSLRGPILTALTVLFIELLNRSGIVEIGNPVSIYLIPVVYAVLNGGLRTGLFSALIGLAYALYFFSPPGQLFHYSPENSQQLLIAIISTVALVLIASVFKHWSGICAKAIKLNAVFKEKIAQYRQREKKTREINAHLRRRMAEQEAELHTLNKELETFGYSIAHILNSPLMAINGFGYVLLEDYADKLDDTGRGYLQRMRASSDYLSGLIDRFLKLGRIARSEVERETVNLSSLAWEIASRLQAAQPERSVDFVIAADVVAYGDARLLETVLDNLLRNAWKFSRPRARARIEFALLETPVERIYVVSDNGVGFDMDYINKLFLPFERLHHLTEFEGVGIGLATIKLIVLRHGGRMWAEGEVDRGARFYFTLGEGDKLA